MTYYAGQKLTITDDCARANTEPVVSPGAYFKKGDKVTVVRGPDLDNDYHVQGSEVPYYIHKRFLAPIDAAEDDALHYRGVPVPSELVPHWGEPNALQWRRGVVDAQKAAD